MGDVRPAPTRQENKMGIVAGALGRRGRRQTPSEVVLRMLILKRVRNWSYQTPERKVRANVVYRRFCHIGMEKVPDAETLVRQGQTVGPEAIRELHDRPGWHGAGAQRHR